MADITLSVTVDIGDAEIAQTQDELINVVLDWAEQHGYQAAAGTGDDAWLERELAAALRALSRYDGHSANDDERAQVALAKYDAIYSETGDEAPAHQP